MTTSCTSIARVVMLGAIAILLAACGIFHGKPPLPKYASVDSAARPSSAENFAALVPDADVIYFPVENAAQTGRVEPAAQLLNALRQTGAPLAIAWDIIDASQQPLLDQLQTADAASREGLIARLELAGTGRAREYCRSVLRAQDAAAIRHLAIAPPAAMVAKVGVGEALSGDEQASVPRGFRPPAGALEAFTERLGPTRSANDAEVAKLYRAHLLTEQFAADQIARHFHGGGAGGKLLVFLRDSDLEPGRGVPYFVTQKVQLRQLVFGRNRPGGARGKLLTGL